MPLTNPVREIIAAKLSLPVDEVTPEAKFKEELGADSLDAVEIIMALEERFSLEIPDDDTTGLTNLSAVCAYLDKRGVQAP